jgi:predicted CXXCH cytochrome family protein
VRGLLAVGGFTVAAAVIGVFLTVSDSSGRAVISAGPLTGGHANFTAKTGCVACHKPHNGDLGGWAMAAFHEDDLTDNCLACHTFGGDARLGHNAPSDISPRGRETSCVECHTEHKGERFDIVTVTDKACNACHKQRVDSFGENHPQFAANFPHDRRTAIVFDHTSHMAKHFVDARYTDVAPENCTSCHEMQGAAKQFVRPKNFDETCVTCHADNIVSRDLVLLRLPEFSENLLDKQKVMEACGPTLEQWRTMMEAMSGGAEMDEMQEVMKEEEEYEPISSEEASAISAYLLGMAPDDPDDLEMQGFVWRLILEGERPIAELIDARAGRRVSDRLLAGLNQELVRRVACAWASNVEYEPPNDPEFGGWYGDGLELKYRPPHAKGHADPVAYEWAMFAAASAKEDDAALVEFAEAMRAIVLSRSEGVGACVKCHAVSDDGEGGLAIEWRYEESTTRPFTRFNHPMHLTLVNPEGINLMDPDAGCRTCHKTNDGAAYQASFDGTDPHRFESNFASMTKETCTQCHNAGKVRQECKTCHSYHFKPGFDLRMAKDAH